jgi:hypothetical protein
MHLLENRRQAKYLLWLVPLGQASHWPMKRQIGSLRHIDALLGTLPINFVLALAKTKLRVSLARRK